MGAESVQGKVFAAAGVTAATASAPFAGTIRRWKMARSNRNPAIFAGEELTADEQAAFDAMRDDDAAPAPAPEPRRQPRARAEAPAEDPELPVDDTVEDLPPADEGAAGDATPAAQRPQTVPHAALHEERLRRQETERQLAEERRQRQVLDERTNLLLQRIAQVQTPPAQPDAPKIPERDQDPIGHFDARQAQLEAVVRDLAQGTQQQRQQTQAQQVMQQVVGRCMEQEANFRTETPDYDAAAQFLRESRDRQLIAIGMDNPLERRQWIDNEAQQIAVGSVQRRTNFAKAIYDLAVVSGYAKAPPAPTADPAAAAAADPAARLEQQRQGQQQARSLGTARGSAPPPALNAQRMIEMNDAQFSAMLEKLTPGQMRQYFGD